MAEILPWNNAFNAGAGSIPSIPVSGMQLPSGDASGAGAFMNALTAGRQASAQRQNMAIQREQMDMQRQKFQYEMQQDMLKSIMAQREMAQNKLVGQHFKNAVTEDGKLDYATLMTSIAEDPNLLEKAPEIITTTIGLQKISAETVSKNMDIAQAKHKAISMAAGAAIKEAAGGEIQIGAVVRGLAQLGASGVLTTEEVSEIVNGLPKKGPELTAWVQTAFDSSEQSAQTIESVRGKLQIIQRGGDFKPIRTFDDGRVEIAGDSIPQTPTISESTAVVNMQTPNGEEVPRRIPIMGEPASGAPGAAPAGGPGELRLPQTEEIVNARKDVEKRFSDTYETVKTDSERIQAAKDQLVKVKKALETFTPGAGMSTIRLPVGKALNAVGLEPVGDAIAGGDVSAAEVMASEGAKSAFSVIKSLGVVNRDLSAPELKMSKEATFGPDITKQTAEVMVKNAEAAIEYQDLRMKFLSWYLANYKKDPRTAVERGFDLDQAVNTFHAKLKDGSIAPKRKFDFVGTE